MNAPLLVGLPSNAGTSTLVTWARGRVPMRQPELTDAQRAVPAGVLAADTGVPVDFLANVTVAPQGTTQTRRSYTARSSAAQRGHGGGALARVDAR